MRKSKLEFLEPNIFKQYPILCGMSMKGEISEYQPSGFSFRKASLTDEQFKVHVESMENSIGSGIGKKIVSLNQVHGDQIHEAGLSMLPDGDGIYTNNPDLVLGIALAVRSAFCDLALPQVLATLNSNTNKIEVGLVEEVYPDKDNTD